jgi:tetratricopeptide (TPR) repeat protein
MMKYCRPSMAADDNPQITYCRATRWQKEEGMKAKGTLLKVGLFVLMGLIVSIVNGYATQSDYFNPTVGDKNTVSYWLDQGGLLSTYGNYSAAVRAYEKALEIDPDNSEAIFNIGVASAEMGDFSKAISYINKAMTLSINNGRYFYGRAWVKLLAGQSQDARNDFQKAAELGDLDAIMFLQRWEDKS